MQILIATDGSRPAQEAVRFGAVIGATLDAELALIGVADSPRRSPDLQRRLAAIAETLGYGKLIPVNVLSGTPAVRIEEATRSENVDLLVVGARARSRVGRLFLGDTGQRLARNVRIPMIIVRRSRPAIRRVLVCTAGGEHGRIDAEYAANIAAAAGASLTILHVMSQVPVGGRAGTELYERSAAWHQEHGTREGEHLSSLVNLAEERGVEAVPQVRWGLVVDEILAEARKVDYDLVAVGAHGGTGRQSFFLEDVTEEIIANLNRPVLIVR